MLASYCYLKESMKTNDTAHERVGLSQVAAVGETCSSNSVVLTTA